jgi:hypothetical protein
MTSKSPHSAFNGGGGGFDTEIAECMGPVARCARLQQPALLLRPYGEGTSMLKRVAVTTLAAMSLAGPALAEPVIFTWTGYGLNVPGSGKCPTYKMTIDVTVVGTDVQGRFQQEGRPERNFKATLGADMKFKTTAIVGGGNQMDVVGSLKEGASTIMLDGYCLFEGKLTKK